MEIDLGKRDRWMCDAGWWLHVLGIDDDCQIGKFPAMSTCIRLFRFHFEKKTRRGKTETTNNASASTDKNTTIIKDDILPQIRPLCAGK